MPPIKNIVFFGTPAFAVPTLEALVAAEKAPALVVTQPARRAGRGQGLTEPPVAIAARQHGLEVLQPPSVKDPAFIESIRALKPDAAVVVAFGQIFSKELLELPKKGCINLHASMLPKYRGASPIHSAIAAGDKRSGVTTMSMEEALDAGPILLQEEVDMRRGETTGELTERLSEVGARLMIETLDQLGQNKIKPRKQREESASYAGRLRKQDGRVDWAMPAAELYNRLRAYSPWPGLMTHFKGRPVKLVWGVPMTWEQAPMGVSGTYLGLRQGRMAVLCGHDTVFAIEELQRPGKRPLRALDFVNGERVQVGESFA